MQSTGAGELQAPQSAAKPPEILAGTEVYLTAYAATLQSIAIPPLICSFWPVMYRPSLDARNRQPEGDIERRTEALGRENTAISPFCLSFKTSVMAVLMNPGATQWERCRLSYDHLVERRVGYRLA